MKTTGTIILGAYIAVIMVALFLGPLILLHGYREWWLVTFDVLFACAFIGGSIRHYAPSPRLGVSPSAGPRADELLPGRRAGGYVVGRHDNPGRQEQE